MPPCKLDIGFSRFKNEVAKACKRHHGLKDELQALFAALEKDYEGGKTNKQVPEVSGEHVRKIRVGSEKDRIKPADGYRLILRVYEVNGQAIAEGLSFYYKPDRGNMSAAEILKLVAKSKLSVKCEEPPEGK